MDSIIDISKKLGLDSNDLELYGNYMAKIKKESVKRGKLVLVTAITPTKYGEGKTTVTIGLNDSLWKLGKRSVACLREPSLGPVFGMKGGACGGGKASIIPEEDINLHFTGDFHAITAANDLLSSAIDNHIYQGNDLEIDKVVFKRCLDVNDRSLRDKFNITAASEVMAVFCLAKDKEDLRNRLASILVGYSKSGKEIYAKDLSVDGAMFKLLEKAFLPNLVQSLYGNPVLVHGGPFANIAHGCCSINSLKLGLGLADYVITEAGFGSDLGFEKFMNITSRYGDIYPDYVVLVATVRGLKENGISNLNAHIDNIKQYNVPFCVCLNHFEEDNEKDIALIRRVCIDNNIPFVLGNSYKEGENGSIDLANLIVDNNDSVSLRYLYDLNLSVKEKIEIIAKKTYNANSINYSEEAIRNIELIERNSFNYPVCMAKTQYSMSDKKELKGYPNNYEIYVKDVYVETGSKMIIVLLNDIITMPGLPKEPNYLKME